MKIPKISVIIPVYNTEKYLAQCMDSIIAQTFKDFECVCVNDGSTDNSLKILEEYSKKDNRIKIISQENAGPSNAKNVGIKNSKCDYITFIDSDDFVSTDYLEKLYLRIIDKGYDLVYCKHKLYYSLDKAYNIQKNENNLSELVKKINSSDDKNFILKNLLFLVENARSSCMKLYKIDVIKNNNILFFEDIYAQSDYVYNILFAMYSLKNISFVDEELYYYRKQVKSITVDKDRMAINGLKSFIALTKSLQERNLLQDNKIMHNFIFKGFIQRLGKKISPKQQEMIFSLILEHFEYLKNILKKDSLIKCKLYFYSFLTKTFKTKSLNFFRIIKNFI